MVSMYMVFALRSGYCSATAMKRDMAWVRKFSWASASAAVLFAVMG